MDDLKNMVYFNYLDEKDWGKRILAKLTHDLEADNQNQKKRIIQFRPSMYQSSPHPPPHHPHPEERIWAGRTPRRKPRVPDAPKIKHDKMKPFYMIDIERKRW